MLRGTIACKTDQQLVQCEHRTVRGKSASISCHLRGAKLAHSAALCADMRRTPAMSSVSKSRTAYTPLAQAKGDESDVALSAGSEMRPTIDNSPQSKSKSSKSSFTVFGLKPSPELLSISMGKQSSQHGVGRMPAYSLRFATKIVCAMQSTLYREYLGLLG